MRLEKDEEQFANHTHTSLNCLADPQHLEDSQVGRWMEKWKELFSLLET